MKADVSLCPAVQPWSKNIISAPRHLTRWVSPSPLPPLDSSRASCENMYSGLTPDPQVLEAQLDFFHKLGYSTAQVQAVQQKFGPIVDTDKVLGELVRIGPGLEAKQGPVTTMSVLVPRGEPEAAGPTLLLPVSSSSPQSKEEGSEEGSTLRPVVIDGSNVAMR